MKKVLIYLETNQTQIKKVSLELISKAKELTKDFDDFKIIGVLVSSYNFDEQVLKQLGLDKVILCNTRNLETYSTLEYTKVLQDVITKENPQIVFVGATNQGRDLAPRVAARLNTGLTADCTELNISEDAKLTATRPTFGGSLMAQILCKTTPQMATVRPNVFKFISQTEQENFEFERIEYDLNSNIEIFDIKEKSEELCNYNDTEIIFAGGLGLKNKENFELLKQLAQKYNAKVGASRKAVEKELIEKKYQIGQTGQTVVPKLYFAFGISGAIQHISGIENAQTIIAINPDKNAQIHKVADYSIFTDATELIKKWLN